VTKNKISEALEGKVLVLPVSAVKCIIAQVGKSGCKPILACWFTLESKQKGKRGLSKCELNRNWKGPEAQRVLHCPKMFKFPYIFRGVILYLHMLFHIVTILLCNICWYSCVGGFFILIRF